MSARALCTRASQPNELAATSARGMTPRTACVLLSGGMDSAICLAHTVDRLGADRVLALSIRYGQSHAVEIAAARRIATLFGVEHVEREVSIPWRPSSLTGGGGSPVVPGRNAILATLAAAEIASRGGCLIVMGCCANDAEVFPDCRAEFVLALARTLELGYGPTLDAPLVDMTKAEALRMAHTLPKGREAVAASWSCYAPQSAGARSPVPCLVCPACVHRAEAFRVIGEPDPGGR